MTDLIPLRESLFCISSLFLITHYMLKKRFGNFHLYIMVIFHLVLFGYNSDCSKFCCCCCCCFFFAQLFLFNDFLQFFTKNDTSQKIKDLAILDKPGDNR